MKNNNITQDHSKEYDELLEKINKNGGFLTININYLRDIHGIIKLTENTCLPIVQYLSKRGISSYPDISKTKSNKIIRLYVESSIAGSIISTLSPDNTSKDCDKLIKDISMLISLRECQKSLNIYDTILEFFVVEAAMMFDHFNEEHIDARKKSFIKNLNDKLNNKTSTEDVKESFSDLFTYIAKPTNLDER